MSHYRPEEKDLPFWPYLVIGLIVIVVFSVLILYLERSRYCEEQGGVLVRTAFSYVCVRPTKWQP